MESKKIKIIRIQSRIVIGGPALHTICLAGNLDTNRFETVLVGGSGDEDESSMIAEARRRNIDCVDIPELGRDIHFYDDLISFFKIYNLIRKIRPAIVHTHTAKAGAIGRLAAYIAGVPFIYHTFHGHVFTGYFNPVKTKLFIFIERVLAKLSTKIIVISRKQRNDIVETFKIAPHEKVALIPLGFDWRITDGQERDRTEFKKKYRVPENKTVIAIVGRIVPIKDHLLFLKIASELIRTDKDKFHFMIVGDGEMREMIERKVNEDGLNHFFTFTGWITDTNILYNNIDILLLTSKNEGTPVTIIEALAYGVPVIARDVGGVADIYDFYDREYLINGADPLQFVAAIKKVVGRNLAISEETKKNICTFYSAGRLISDMEKLYLDLWSINDKIEKK